MKILEDALLVKKLRRDGRGYHWTMELVFFLFSMLGPYLITSGILAIVMDHLSDPVSFNQLPAVAKIAIRSIPLGILPVVTIFIARVIQKRRVFTTDCSEDPAGAEYWRGAASALFGVISIVLLGKVLKVFEVIFQTGMNFLLVLLWFAICCAQGAMEEIIFRGGLFLSLIRKNNVLWSAVLTSLVYAFAHFGMSGFGIVPAVTLFLLSLFTSLITVRRGSIAMSCAFHGFWIFGRTALFHLDTLEAHANSFAFLVQTDERHLLSGGAFGLDGSVLALGMILIMLCFELVYWRNRELDKNENKIDSLDENMVF